MKNVEVFKKVFIPRTLGEVSHYEDHVEDGSHANTDEVFYRSVTGLNMELSGAQSRPAFLGDEEEDSEEDEESESDESEQEGDQVQGDELAPGENAEIDGPDLSKMDKKERKKYVKEMQREKRQNKIPKHVKKRYKKVTQVKKGHK